MVWWFVCGWLWELRSCLVKFVSVAWWLAYSIFTVLCATFCNHLYSLELLMMGIIGGVVLYIFVMCGGLYVWVLYCMDVWGLCNNVGVDMVGIIMVWVFWKWETAFLDYPDWGSSVLFLSCKTNTRVKLAKSGHGPHLFRIIVICVVLVIVLCYCLYAVLLLLCCTVIVLLCYYLCCPKYWLCVLYHCHRVLTQLQLTNISYIIWKSQNK